MKKSYILFLLVVGFVSSRKPVPPLTPCSSIDEEIYFETHVGKVSSFDNTCGLVLFIDSVQAGFSDFGGHPINLNDSIEFGDVIYIQFKLLLDSFYC